MSQSRKWEKIMEKTDERKILLKMLEALLVDIQNLQHKGAGYFSPSPFVQRYDKLLEKAKIIFPKDSLLLDTFTPVEDSAAREPEEKMKIIQKVVIEAGQLIAYIKAVLEE